ncbi:hypothetical protein N3K66_005978 [Trichothecium roseum]|uniref:Uncharacterized protein n=1 Tax=Trichothecium roseum TaxID=47278 RepID=A0ACC0V120_9HYPO|nr:hypothetical protein N3K66_005978 [Trichothecium roseum]
MSSSSNNQSQRTLDGWLSGPRPTASSPAVGPSRTQASNSSSRQQSSATSARDKQRAALAAISKETRIVLPDILPQIPHAHASKSEALFLSTLLALKTADCPRRTASGKAKIKIINDDTLNVAISLAAHAPNGGRVAVLNMASHSNPGGGWLSGASAQEEALCYRSSLALSLHKRYYPWEQRMGIYTPDVVVIRSDIPSGHKLLVPDMKPLDLPIVSALSIAAPRNPKTARVTRTAPAGGTYQRTVYADPATRELMKDKMRLCLRMAAHRDHGLLVLGALGCGAFHNPRREVAWCWLEVLREQEFAGGWWQEVWFAVYDRRNEGNFEAFEEILEGVEV